MESIQAESADQLDNAQVLERIDTLIEMQKRLESQTENWMSTVLHRMERLESQFGAGGTSGSASDASEELNWDAQKKALFAEYGGEDTSSLADFGISDLADSSNTSMKASSPIDPLSVDLSKIDPDSDDQTTLSEIEELKAALQEKMRQTEMELSIGRAKLSQERAELEDRRAELKRMAKKLGAQASVQEKKAAAQKSAQKDPRKKASVLDRLTRHMQTFKKPDEE